MAWNRGNYGLNQISILKQLNKTQKGAKIVSAMFIPQPKKRITYTLSQNQ